MTSNQKSVSFADFNAIASYFISSFLEILDFASCMLAPTEVPLLLI